MHNNYAVKNFINEIIVYDCDLTKIRIGNQGDGGYIAALELCETTEVVYSLGIGDNNYFEYDFAKKFNCFEIHMFDPYIDVLPRYHSKFIWKKNKLTDLKDMETQGKNAFLKIDIEWDEWDLFLRSSDEAMRNFSQIIVEFHIVHVPDILPGQYSPYFSQFYQKIYDEFNTKLFIKYRKTITKINQWFYLFHIHANNSLPKIKTGGYSFPPLLEMSFVRKDLVGNASLTKAKFPIPELDYPNKPDRKDIEKVYPI